MKPLDGNLNLVREYPDSSLNAQKPVEVYGGCGLLFPMRSHLDIEEWDIYLRRKAGKGWADWLLSEDWGWQWYITLTFLEDVHPEQADKCFRRWVRKQNERIYGKRYRQRHKGITWVRGMEYQRRGVIHFHSLFSDIPEDWEDEEFRFKAMRDWENTADKCGYSRVFPYKEGACRYISKYISKGGVLDIWIGNKKLLDPMSMIAV